MRWFCHPASSADRYQRKLLRCVVAQYMRIITVVGRTESMHVEVFRLAVSF